MYEGSLGVLNPFWNFDNQKIVLKTSRNAHNIHAKSTVTCKKLSGTTIWKQNWSDDLVFTVLPNYVW